MTGIECVGTTKAKLGENPIWDDHKQGLWWIDIYGQNLHFHHPDTQANQTWPMPGKIAGVALAESGKLMAGMGGDVILIEVGPDVAIQKICTPVTDTSARRLNEARVDPTGKYYWVGEACLDFDDRSASLFRVDAKGNCETFLSGIGVSNGLAWSPDGRTLYFADTPTSTVWRFDYNLETGTLGERQVFREFTANEGRPDGASVDTEGYYWIACVDHGKIFRLAPDGSTDLVVQMPVNYPTMCAFGGPEMSDIYVSSLSWRPINGQPTNEDLAGRLFRFQTEICGVSETRMKGV